MQTKSEESWRPAPETSSLAEVRDAARDCTACHLYKRATQTVFGEGPQGAPIMLVGEQPGDYEDMAGKPFVGPAEKLWIARSKKPESIASKFTSQTQ
jgi:uracil-DNA glycosylase